MNKYQEALTNIIYSVSHLNDHIYECDDICDEYVDDILTDCDLLQKLVDKATPKKLKNKTDKDGRLLLVCPTCGDVYMKFWSEVETVSCRNHCDNCGQALDWSNTNEQMLCKK